MNMRRPMVLLILLGWLIPIGVTRAEGIVVSNINAAYEFARSLTFTVTAASDAPITTAKVFYQSGSSPAIGRAADLFTSALQVELSASVIFTASKPAAFSTISYWWEITDEAGKALRTDTYTLAYIDNRFKWQDLTSGAVRVHWYQGDSGFGATAASIANEALPRIQQQVGVEPPSPIDIYIYASLDDLKNVLELAGRPWLGGQARPALGVVMVAIPLGDSVNIQMRRDIPHELTHLMVYVAAVPGYDHVPRWLDEGLATLNEGEPNSSQAVALQEAQAANKVPSLETLCGVFPTDSSDAFAAYAVSRNVAQAIINEYGTAGIQALLAAYHDGATCAGGVERALNTTLSGLDLKWRTSIEPVDGVTTVARTSAPWLVLWLIIAVPLIVVLVAAWRSVKRDKLKG